MQLSEKLNHFVEFFFHFGNLHQILDLLKKKMTLIAQVFPKLQSVKDMFRQMFKQPRFRAPFNSQHIKVSQTLMKTASQHFYHIF